MGWGLNDGPIREQLKVQVSLTRREAYKLKQLVAQISHEEKQVQLKKSCGAVDDSLDAIAFTLSR